MVERLDLLPIHMDLLLWEYDGPYWEVAQLAGREGWLMTGRAERDTPVGRLSRTLTVAITDNGEPLSDSLSLRLLDIPSNNIGDPVLAPPEELDRLLDECCLEFLEETDGICLDKLLAASQECDREISAFESGLSRVESRIWDLRRKLRQKSRQIVGDLKRQKAIEAQLVTLSVLLDKMPQGARRHVKKIRSRLSSLEKSVLNTLSEDCELEVLFSAHWRAIGRWRLTLPPGFIQP